jgi:hypothetical protein
MPRRRLDCCRSSLFPFSLAWSRPGTRQPPCRDTAKFAALMLFGKVTGFLGDVLPLSTTTHANRSKPHGMRAPIANVGAIAAKDDVVR